jgi:hypothetical protein
MQRRLLVNSAFSQDKMGATYALKRTLDAAVRAGILHRFADGRLPDDLKAAVGTFHGELFQILDLTHEMLAVS